jgi:RNA polymerase sigma factor (sigma-70 family)
MRTRVRNGDPDAFAELFDECARAVYNHAFRLTADWSLAEDVMSTTFMEAWRRRASVEAEGGSLRPWLLGIATNVARSQQRGERRGSRARRRGTGRGPRRGDRRTPGRPAPYQRHARRPQSAQASRA